MHILFSQIFFQHSNFFIIWFFFQHKFANNLSNFSCPTVILFSKFSMPYVYSFCQIFQALRLFPALRLLRTLEYIKLQKWHRKKIFSVMDWFPIFFLFISIIYLIFFSNSRRKLLRVKNHTGLSWNSMETYEICPCQFSSWTT